jgi:hypothetical protein
MLNENTTEIGNIGNSPFKAMVIRLALLDFNLGEVETDAEIADLLEQHWALRKQIETTPMRTINDLSWFSVATQIEIERDPEFTNDAPGSARALAKALADGALKLAGAPQ